MDISRREMILLPVLQILISQPQPVQDILCHSLKSVTEVIICITNNRNSLCSQEFIPNTVLLKMLRELVLPTVDFNRQFCTRNVKIKNVIPNVFLSFNKYRKSFQKIVPKMPLLSRHISSQFLCIGNQFLVVRIHDLPTPKTNPRRPSIDSLRGAFSKNTRFHPNISLAGHRAPIQLSRKGGIRPNLHGGTHSRSACGAIPILCRYPSGDVFLSAGGCPIHYFLRRLYSERGFMTSRQSRSPRSSAMTSTSAVAMLVATGMLYRSHMRSSSCSVSS